MFSVFDCFMVMVSTFKVYLLSLYRYVCLSLIASYIRFFSFKHLKVLYSEIVSAGVLSLIVSWLWLLL